MDYIRRFLGESDNSGDMIYAYKKGMPLILTEMALRQHREDIGKFVRLTNNGSRPTWGTWLALSISKYIINVAPRAIIKLYNAWGELKATGYGPSSFLVEIGGVNYPHTLRCDTAVAKVIVETEYEEEGENISINITAPLWDPYYLATLESEYKTTVVIEPMDPQYLSGREYFALLNTLVATNPTKDARLMRGLNYSDSAPNAVLEAVKTKSLAQ
jgi:hypothetical protein